MKTFITYIIDQSGSMLSRRDTVLQGFNEFIQDQLSIKDCFVSLYTFNHTLSTVFEKLAVKDVKPLSNNDYIPMGTTALYDAMGDVISKIDTTPTTERRITRSMTKGDKFVVIVLTDGEENSSRTYTRQQIKDLLTEKDYIEVVYVGSNQDAILNGKNMGTGTALKYSDNALGTAMRCTSEAVKRYTSSKTPTIEFTQLERDISLGQ